MSKTWAIRYRHKKLPGTFGFNYFETKEEAEKKLKTYDKDYQKRCKIINNKSKLWA